jgi:RND family efflux transporter MFP subunit
MKRIINILIALLALVGIGAAISWKLTENKEVITAQAKVAAVRNESIPVKTSTVDRKFIDGNFEIIGTFQPYKQLSVVSDVNGRITQLNYKNGDVVSEGATILAVDHDLLENQLNISRLNLQKGQKDLERLKNLVGDGGVTQQQVDDLTNNIETIKLQIKGLEKQISLTIVKAPIGGSVSNKQVEKGAVMAPGMKILDIIDIRRLKMAVYLTEDEVQQVRKGQRVELKADLYPNRTFAGVATLIDVKADNSKRFLVEVELDNPASAPLKAGMDGHAVFNSGKQLSILALPRESVVGSIRSAKVFVIENNIAHLRPVELGTIYGDVVAILDGLKAGDVVVTAGQINLEDGMKVTVENN